MGPDRDVYELDLTLWHLLRDVARAHPQVARDYYDLPESVVTALAGMADADMERIASGVLFSFVPGASEESIQKALNGGYTRTCLLTLQHRPLDNAYWLQIRDVAREHGAAQAAQMFGMAETLVNAIQNSSLMQLRGLGRTVELQLRLRYPAETVQALISGVAEDIQYLKFQQALAV